jgi:hypothetical protein
MAERFVEAASIFVTIALDGQSQRSVYCLVSINRNYTTNMNDASSICNPAAKSPGTQDFSVDMTLQRVWDPGGSHYSEKFLQDALVNKSVVDFTVGPASPATGDLVETGTGYITSETKTDNATDRGTMDITITMTEAPVLTVTT